MTYNSKEDIVVEVGLARKEEILKYHSCLNEIAIIKENQFLGCLKQYIQESGYTYDFQFVEENLILSQRENISVVKIEIYGLINIKTRA